MNFVTDRYISTQHFATSQGVACTQSSFYTKKASFFILELIVKKLNIKNFNMNGHYPGEVCENYFNKIMRSKKFLNIVEKYDLQDNEEMDVESISLIDVFRQKINHSVLPNLNQLCQQFFKIKLKDGQSKYFELPKQPSYKQDGFPFEDYSLRYKHNFVLFSPFFAKEETYKEEYNDSYEDIEVFLIEDLGQRLRKGSHVTLLEVCSGQNNFSHQILRDYNSEIDNFWLIDSDAEECQKAQEVAKKRNWPLYSVCSSDIAKVEFSQIIGNSVPCIIIVSGVLTERAVSDTQEARFILKKLISLMPEKGIIYLLGLKGQHVSLADVQKIYPLTALNAVTPEFREFLILKKKKRKRPAFKVDKEGMLDLFYLFDKYPDSSLKDLFEAHAKQLEQVRSIDLSLCPVNDLSALSMLPHLKELHLAGVKNLNSLLLRSNPSLFKELKTLDVSFSDVSEEALIYLLSESQLIQLRLDFCENFSVRRQIELMFLYTQNTPILNLEFINRKSYQEPVDFPLEMIRMRPNKIVVRLSSLDKNSQLAKWVKETARQGAKLEIIYDEKGWIDSKTILEQHHEIFKLEPDKCFQQIGLYTFELNQIKQYLREKHQSLVAKARESGPFTLRKKESGLPRAVEIHPTGKMYLLLRSKNTSLLGQGEQKKIKKCLDIANNSLVASYTVPYQNNKNKITILKYLSSVQPKGVAKVLACSTYFSSKIERKKIHVILEYCHYGNYLDFISSHSISNQYKKKFCLDIFDAIINLHLLGYAYLDIHIENILIRQGAEGILEAIFGDLDSIEKISAQTLNEYSKYNIKFFPPDCIKEMQLAAQTSLNFLNPSFCEKLEVWMMGLTMAQMFDINVPFLNYAIYLWSELNNHFQHIQRNPFPKPENKNSIEYLIWQMLSIDPKQRISLEEAKKQLIELDFNLAKLNAE